ncbi:hypothetical protein [Nocardia sp. NPDC051463]|uniref:hypothetical protein n=1 Tax=Nocardia sp. NPDC051463 TaxID=3154845 RepID=UPI00344CC335
MKRLGPLLTLRAVAGPATVLLIVTMSKETEPTQAIPSVTATQAHRLPARPRQFRSRRPNGITS